MSNTTNNNDTSNNTDASNQPETVKGTELLDKQGSPNKSDDLEKSGIYDDKSDTEGVEVISRCLQRNAERKERTLQLAIAIDQRLNDIQVHDCSSSYNTEQCPGASPETEEGTRRKLKKQPKHQLLTALKPESEAVVESGHVAEFAYRPFLSMELSAEFRIWTYEYAFVDRYRQVPIQKAQAPRSLSPLAVRRKDVPGYPRQIKADLGSSKPSFPINLLRTDWVIRNEAAAVQYGTNEFQFDSMPAFHDWLVRIRHCRYWVSSVGCDTYQIGTARATFNLLADSVRLDRLAFRVDVLPASYQNAPARLLGDFRYLMEQIGAVKGDALAGLEVLKVRFYGGRGEAAYYGVLKALLLQRPS